MLLFSLAVMEPIVNQTKQFAAHKSGELELTVEEFLGIYIAIRLLCLPQKKTIGLRVRCWQHLGFWHLWPETDLAILRYLHLTDSSQQKKKGKKGYDTLYKVRALVIHLTATFSKYYHPDCYLSVDEMMIGIRCCLAFLQYLPKKSTCFGIKIWVVSESKTGYILDFEVYTGAKEDAPDTGLGHRVVVDLTEQYQHKGHRLFIDNFYTVVGRPSPERYLLH